MKFALSRPLQDQEYVLRWSLELFISSCAYTGRNMFLLVDDVLAGKGQILGLRFWDVLGCHAREYSCSYCTPHTVLLTPILLVLFKIHFVAGQKRGELILCLFNSLHVLMLTDNGEMGRSVEANACEWQSILYFADDGVLWGTAGTCRTSLWCACFQTLCVTQVLVFLALHHPFQPSRKTHEPVAYHMMVLHWFILSMLIKSIFISTPRCTV